MLNKEQINEALYDNVFIVSFSIGCDELENSKNMSKIFLDKIHEQVEGKANSLGLINGMYSYHILNTVKTEGHLFTGIYYAVAIQISHIPELLKEFEDMEERLAGGL